MIGRAWLNGVLALLLLPGTVSPSAAQVSSSSTIVADYGLGFADPTEDARLIAARAFVWGYPLVRSAQLRQNLTRPEDPLQPHPPSSPGAAINRFGHARELGSPRMRQGVAPNNDTLYSLAWLDMKTGPFVLETPDFGDRYYTFQMGQADSSTEQSLGRRTHGSKLPPVFIQAEGQRRRVPRGMVEVLATQRYLMIAGRVLVTGPSDIDAVGALQRQIRLRRWEDYRRRRDVLPPITEQRRVSTAPFAKDPAAFLTSLGEVLRDWQPSAEEAALVRSFERIGLSGRHGYRPKRLSPSVLQSSLRGVADGEGAVRQKTFTLGKNARGWSINNAGSVFARDYLLRAAVAMDQIYVLPREEALYPNARLDSEGRTLDGRNSYELHFSKEQLPPVHFFWSATMYHAQGLMVDNPIGRYAIGDRTAGLIREPDGGIRILIQNARPAELAKVNWLPAPAGPFMLMMRLYGPLERAQSGRWTPPGIVRTGAN